MLNDRIEHQLRSEVANVIQHDLTTVDLAMTHEPFEYSVFSTLKWEQTMDPTSSFIESSE